MMTSLSSPQTARGSHRSILTEKRRGKHDFCQVTILIGVSATLFGFLIRNEKNLHLISINLEEIQEGEIILDGNPVRMEGSDLVKLRERIGMVFQSYDLFPHMTVLENIMLAPVKVKKRSKKEVEKEAMELLERVGLLEKKDYYPRQLSGGQKQRVAIVRALIMHPEILLLDEITAALDPEMVREVLDVVLALAREGRTMLIVTHEMQFARAVADRMIFLEGGNIVEEGTAEEFFERPKTERLKKFLQTFSYEK